MRANVLNTKDAEDLNGEEKVGEWTLGSRMEATVNNAKTMMMTFL